MAGRQRDVGRETRALRAERILDHLHQDLVSLGHERSNAFGARRLEPGIRMIRVDNVGGMQKRGALEPDIDERGLHAG